MKEKRIFIMVEIGESLKADIKKKAQSKGLSMTAYCRMILLESLKD